MHTQTVRVELLIINTVPSPRVESMHKLERVRIETSELCIKSECLFELVTGGERMQRPILLKEADTVDL